MRGQFVGSIVAATFGLVFVLANTGSMPEAARIGLCAAAVIAFVAVAVSVVTALRGRRPKPVGGSTQASGPGFGLSYWLVVVAEVAALLVGTRVLSGPLDLPQAGVAWVSLVVGAHFFALAIVFRQHFFHILGVALVLCGLAGLGIALTGGGEAWIDLISGVVPGGLLLVAGWWGTHRDPAAETAAASTSATSQRSS